MNRSIQVEGAFGVLKNDYEFQSAEKSNLINVRKKQERNLNMPVSFLFLVDRKSEGIAQSYKCLFSSFFYSIDIFTS